MAQNNIYFWNTNQQVNPLIPWATLPARQTLTDYASKAQQLWLGDLGGYFKSLVWDLASRDTQDKWLFDIYNSFWSYLQPMMNNRNSFYGALDKDMLWKLSELMIWYKDTYWPNGTQMSKVNQLYGWYWDLLLNRTAQNQMVQSWLNNKYWLSDNAKRIANNDVWLQGLSEVLKVFDEQTKAIDNINKTFTSLNTDAFAKYKWIQDDYLKSLYDQNFWIGVQTAQWLINMLANNEQAKRQLELQAKYAPKTSGWSTWGAWATTIPTSLQSPTTNTPTDTQWIPLYVRDNYNNYIKNNNLPNTAETLRRFVDNYAQITNSRQLMWGK